MTDPIAEYLQEIKAVAAINAPDATELSYRAPLQQLLRTLAAEQGGLTVQHEPTPQQDIGAPDFVITATSGAAVGCVECKAPESRLEPLIGGKQLQKYRGLTPNILLTDYWRFYLLAGDKIQAQAELNRNATARQKHDVATLIQSFLQAEAQTIGTAKELAEALANRCVPLRLALAHALQHSNSDNSTLNAVLQSFKDTVYHDIDHAQFADALAQTLVYSLLMAKLGQQSNNKLTVADVEQRIQKNFALVREITRFLRDLPDDVNYLVNNILAVINAMDTAAVTESMAYKSSYTDEDDPYLIFYEKFLAAYDAKMREARGVYYTPPSIVRFIVRAADDILKRDFGIADGLAASEKVTALDFAAGTGTFMLEMFRLVLNGKSLASRDIITRGHLLKNFFGFELLIAPYVIAHLKLSRYLQDSGVALQKNERIRVYLTNTLEVLSAQVAMPFMPALTQETNQAQQLKEKQILVITGNPPYSGESHNKGKWITDLIEDYKKVDGHSLGERNPKWLQDDYVKFIRFSQWKIQQANEGIVAIITNHAFLDNPTFRGMRQSLMDTFDRLYFIDLHGSAKRKRLMPDGNKDENVFDIQQGVAISIMVKKPGLGKGVYRADFWGNREGKYQQCAEHSMDTIKWQELKPATPSYLFIPHNGKIAATYNKLWSVTDIFPVHSIGIVTARDTFTLDFDRAMLHQRLKRFVTLQTEQAREHFNLGKDTRDWKIELAQKDLLESQISESNFHAITYRPFDRRDTYYTGNSRGFHCMPRKDVMHHMIADCNIGLVTVRQARSTNSWRHCFITQGLMEACHISNKGGEINHLFPLYLYRDETQTSAHQENIAPQFRAWIDNRYEEQHTPETILGYIYAILHSPNYRQHYAEFLRIDFPHIPFPTENAEFLSLAKIGDALINAHLLRQHCAGEVELHGSGTTHKVDRVHYDEAAERLYFNKDEYFAPIAAEVFAFYIGGYQPLDKYLKSRKARTLTLNEIDTIRKAANAIAFTVRKMKELDAQSGFIKS